MDTRHRAPRDQPRAREKAAQKNRPTATGTTETFATYLDDYRLSVISRVMIWFVVVFRVSVALVSNPKTRSSCDSFLHKSLVFLYIDGACITQFGLILTIILIILCQMLLSYVFYKISLKKLHTNS